MDSRIRRRIFSIALLTFFLIIFISLVSIFFFDFHPFSEIRKELNPFHKALDEELGFDHLESYEYCFENARTAKPAQEKWTTVPSACSDDVNAVIIVKSSTDRNENRRIIRETWGRNVQLDVDGFRLSSRVIFLIGFSSLQSAMPINSFLQAEKQKHKDILEIDVQDGYIVHNLLQKTLNGLQFIDKFCPKVSMVVIADDDTILVPWVLFGQITPVRDIIENSDQPFFGGVPFLMNIVPRRLSETSRIVFPRDKYPCYSVPTYLQAFAMLLSRKTMKLFLEETNRYYSDVFVDDIYLNWLAYRLNLTFFKFPKGLYDGSCLEDNLIQNDNLFNRNHFHERVEQIGMFHQCDSPKSQVDLWQRLCESFLMNKTMVLKLHTSYCDVWIKRALV